MSEFKVGDKVVLVGAGTKDVLLEIVEHMYTPNMHRVKIIATGQYGPVFKNDIRHATLAEIRIGYRIDNPCKCCNGHGEVGSMLESFVCPECNGNRVEKAEPEILDKPVGSLQELYPEFAKVLHENFLELLGDDFPIENHISPNCKVTEAHINEADKLNRLG
ncbi:hypothetical protein NQ624_08525 [Acinetobacter baumannii]|nr:hypothetical protein [Acinetobacter baumannii]